MFLRYYNEPTVKVPEPRQIKIDLKKVNVISWRYGYNSRRQKNSFYIVYLDRFEQRTSILLPIARIQDTKALFKFMEENHKDKCLEK